MCFIMSQQTGPLDSRLTILSIKKCSTTVMSREINCYIAMLPTISRNQYSKPVARNNLHRVVGMGTPLEYTYFVSRLLFVIIYIIDFAVYFLRMVYKSVVINLTELGIPY